MILHPDSLDLPALQPYRTLRRPEEHRAAGMFVAEGEKVVRRLLASSLQIRSVLLTQEWAERLPVAVLPAAVDVFIAGKSLLRTITGFPMHQGIMAVGVIPREPSAGELLARLSSPVLLAAFDGIAHAENVGVMVRNCAAFGVQGIIAGGTSCSPWVRRAVRNSMGGVFLVPVMHAGDLGGTLATLKRQGGIDVLVTDAHSGTPVGSCNLRRNICLVFGGEQSGVTDEVRRHATGAIRIPMSSGVDSLNVASASAAALYEVRRQRDATPLPHQSSDTTSPGNIGSTPNG
jgi:tRNA G18 (ribose-2'-O)-methylase SpoU